MGISMVELDIKIGAGDLYDYMLLHSYNSASGIIASAIGGLMVVAALPTRQWIWLIGGLVLLLYLPWTLFIKSRQQALTNESFKKPLRYVLDEKGITIMQDEVSETFPWEDMVKAVSTGRSIIVYTGRVNATIFPKTQMGDKKASVIEIISTHMPPSKVKIRG